MNQTIERFGYPATLVAEYEHWLVMLRPAQPTLGSLVLAAKSEARAYAALPEAAFAEQARVIADIEQALTAAVRYERINYLMLMMVDPHVHFHVLPRYEGDRSLCGITVADAGWPKLPDLNTALPLNEEQIAALADYLKTGWPSAR